MAMCKCGVGGPLRRGLCATCYQRERRKSSWQSGRVDAAPVRAHIKTLTAGGLSARRIAELAGVSREQIRQYVTSSRADTGRRRIAEKTARAILAVAIPGGPSVPSEGSAADVGKSRKELILVSTAHAAAAKQPILLPHTNTGAPTNTGKRTNLTLVPDTFVSFVVTPATDDEQWQERALCAQTDPEAFFPEKGGSTREAKRICLGCEVRDACLEYALAHDERFGIWGGLSERERRRLKKGIG